MYLYLYLYLYLSIYMYILNKNKFNTNTKTFSTFPTIHRHEVRLKYPGEGTGTSYVADAKMQKMQQWKVKWPKLQLFAQLNSVGLKLGKILHLWYDWNSDIQSVPDWECSIIFSIASKFMKSRGARTWKMKRTWRSMKAKWNRGRGGEVRAWNFLLSFSRFVNLDGRAGRALINCYLLFSDFLLLP